MDNTQLTAEELRSTNCGCEVLDVIRKHYPAAQDCNERFDVLIRSLETLIVGESKSVQAADRLLDIMIQELKQCRPHIKAVRAMLQ